MILASPKKPKKKELSLEQQLAERNQKKMTKYVEAIDAISKKHGFQYAIVPCPTCEARGHVLTIVPSK